MIVYLTLFKLELVLFRCVSVKLKRQLRNGEWSNSEKKSEKRKSGRSGRRPYTKLYPSNITNQSLLFLQVGPFFVHQKSEIFVSMVATSPLKLYSLL